MWRQMKTATNYVKISAVGNYPEKFLNMCRYKGILIWNINKTDDGIEGYISKNDFMKIKDICHKTYTKVKVLKRKGIGFIMFKYRKHYSFIAGIFIAFAMLYVCSLFIWNISFTGNTRYTGSFLLKYLSSAGINTGIRIKNIDCDYIETSLRSDFKDITWVSAQISGTKLIVHIKENDGAGQITETSNDCRDIVASQSGVVESIITRKGTPLVKKGDTVEKGQILVSGTVKVYDDSGTEADAYNTRADADILIKCELEYSDELNKNYEEKVYTGKTKKINVVRIKDSCIEFGIDFRKFGEADITYETKQIAFENDFYIPVFVGKKQYHEYKTVKKTYSYDEAKSIMAARFNKYIKDLSENEVQILQYNVKMDSNNVCYYSSGKLNVLMPAIEYTDVKIIVKEENSQ